MSVLEPWSDDQRARIAAFCESGDPDDLLGVHDSLWANDNKNSVSASRCRSWRDLLRADPERSAASLPGAFSHTTKGHHACGHCHHPPVSVGEPASLSNHTTTDGNTDTNTDGNDSGADR